MNKVRACWNQNRGAIAGWLQLPGALHAEALAQLDYDALVIDLQHSPVDFAQAVAMLASIESGGAEPFVRLQLNSPSDAMKLLDAGAYGIIAPMVNTRADAQALADALHYPPLGNRSYGPRRPLLRYGQNYLERARETLVGFAMIETREALDNLDAILQVEGLDGVFIGPTDLALELGFTPHADSRQPEVVAAIRHIRERSHERGRKVGIYCASGEFARQKLAEGFDFVTAAPDLGLLVGAARQLLKDVRG